MITKKNILNDREFKGYAAAIHHVIGADWNAPVECVEYHGAFTPLKLRKAARAAGIADNADLVCITWPDKYADNKRWFLINGNDNKPILSISPITADWNVISTIPNYFNSSTFNYYRKCGDNTTLIIAQDMKYQKKPTNTAARKISVDALNVERLNITQVISGRANGKSYVSQFDAIGKSGQKYYWRRFGQIIYSSEIENNTISDIVDKSGYYVYGRRNELKRRAKMLKAQREKAAAADTDLSQYVADINKAVESAIKSTKSAYEKANSADEFAALADVNSRWNGLASLIKSAEKFAETPAESYSSPARIESTANRILQEVNGYINKIESAFAEEA